MQREALPFKQSPRSFVITVFTFSVIIYVTQLFGKHALPSMVRRLLAWRSKRSDTGKTDKIFVGDELGDAPQLVKGLGLEQTLGDEEKASSKSLRVGTLARIASWGIGTTQRGPLDC